MVLELEQSSYTPPFLCHFTFKLLIKICTM
jgi:hypothetical protein